MKNGIHFNEQRRIIKFFQARLRTHFWAMVSLAILLFLLIWSIALFPRHPAPLPAVAMAQRDNLTGTAFLVGSQYALTTARLAGGQSQVFLTFPAKPMVVANVVFVDMDHDVALLQSSEFDPASVPLPLGNSDGISAREDLYILGYAGEVLSHLATVLTRLEPGQLVTDAVANPGNVGAPLLRQADDTVVGMVLSTVEFGGPSERTTHYAIPINLIDQICREHSHPIR